MNEWSIFFEKRHLQKLNEFFVTLEKFRVGKVRLVDIRADEQIYYFLPGMGAEQISENFTFKDEFENFLEELRESFQSKLSEIETP